MRYWSAENARQLHQTPLLCQRVTVWCAISSVAIIGPYFFEENERAVTVNAARYREMIEEFFLPHLEEMDVEDVWFQRDGATALDGIVEKTLPWPHHLSQSRSPLAGALSRFCSMRLFPMGLFEVYRLQRSTTDPSSPEDKHSERYRRNTGGHASESGAKLQKSTQSVHRQWRPSFDICNFQNCMKKNLMR